MSYQDTRAHPREKRKTLEELEGLIRAVQSIGADVNAELKTSTEADKQAALTALEESESLSDQIDGIVK